ncbi:hypothetical protein D3C72_1781740 [compost metagenome]
MVASGNFFSSHTHRAAGVTDLRQHTRELSCKAVEAGGDLRQLVLALGVDAARQITVACADLVHGVAHQGQLAQAPGQDHAQQPDGHQQHQHAGDQGCGQHGADGRHRFALIQSHHQHPRGASDGNHTQQAVAPPNVGLQQAGAVLGGCDQFVHRKVFGQLRNGLEGERRIAVGNDLAVG